MVNNIQKYEELLKLQNDLRTGKIKAEELTYKQMILLTRLYDMQIETLENENEALIEKVVKYKKKIS